MRIGEIVRRWQILAAPLETDLAKSMLIFRVACKLHNFAIAERDPMYDTHGGLGPPASTVSTGVETTGGDAPAPRSRRGNAAAKERRHSWMLRLKAAGLGRRVRAR